MLTDFLKGWIDISATGSHFTVWCLRVNEM